MSSGGELTTFMCRVSINLWSLNLLGGRDSSVGIKTRYGLDGPGIETRWGRDFPYPSRPALGPTHPPVQWVPGLYPGVKRQGRGADHPPPSNCRGQERVGLYLYSPSGPSWPVMGTPLPLTSWTPQGHVGLLRGYF